MAIYRIFPEKDATVYSYYPTMNTGLDEIIEASTTANINGSTSETSRILIKFYDEDIEDIFTNYIGVNQWSASLKMFLADASRMPTTYSLECYPLTQDWEMGVGKYGDVPVNTSGVRWDNFTSSLSAYMTASYLPANVGGGVWYTGSATLNPTATQSFSYQSDLDVNLNVTNAIRLFRSSSISNNGFIIKQETEFTTSSLFELKYFSIDTHTIYPPCLELKWNDYSFNTGSLSIVSSESTVINLGNNKSHYNQNSIQTFRVNARDKFPVRSFTTSSVYMTNKYLPSESYWALKDVNTNETVIDFDTTYTKLSVDSNGSYFKFYMSGIEPERWYKFIIKSVINSNTIIFDNDYIFKVNK